MAKKFKYQRRDYSDARKRAEQNAGNRDSYINDAVSLFKPAEGDNVIRILPPTWDDPKHYGIDLYVHYQVGSDNSAYLCPASMHKHFPELVDDPACPICEERAVADREGDKDYAKKLKPVKRVLVYLIDRDKEKEGIKAWPMPWTVDRDLAIQATDSRTQEYLPIDDPDEGYDVTITRTGTNERTEYGIRIARRSTELDMDEDMEDFIVENPLPTLLRFYPSDYIRSVFEGGAPTGATATATSSESKTAAREEEEEQPAKTPQREARKSSRRRKEEEVEEEAKSDYTWESIHALAGDALDDLIDETGLDFDPAEFKTDEDLADAICEALELSKPKPRAQRRINRREVEEEEVVKEPVTANGDDEEEEEEERPRRSGIRDRLKGMRNKRDEE